jgi:hypothetical protein
MRLVSNMGVSMFRKYGLLAMSVVAMSLASCGFLDSQLSTPAAGGDSPLVKEVATVAPFLGGYGPLALQVTGAVTGVYSFLAHIFGWHQPDPAPAPVQKA